MRRRDFLGIGAGALAGALAGCSGETGQSTDEPTSESTATATASPTGRGTPDSYSVTMAPVGTVRFESTPRTFSVFESGYADMGVALGMGDGLLAVGNEARYDTSYYAQLDGVSVDTSSLTQLMGDSYAIPKGLFYELDSDVHLIDPRWLTNNGYFKLEPADVEEVTERVGPFVGNTIFRRTDGWHDYRYYTMYEAFEKVARVFGRHDRYAAFEALHDGVVARVRSELPRPRDRPNALLTFAGSDEPEAFYPYRLSGLGTNKKQFHDLGIADALAGTGIEGLSTTDRGQIDYETMLEVDPDSILVRGHEDRTETEFRDTVLAFMRDHPVASQLPAVKNGRVFRGGPIYQGPIHHLFNLERFAKNFYPDVFEGKLFSRADLSAVVNGDA